ncbi:hypothetical protein [Methanobrevibacter sp.]|uniref:hypothetical protein n=1 Tax=Methanobrevibacter sp. TaxID=66852 RepID=UPI00388F8FFF
MRKRQISLTLDDELIQQINDFAVKSKMTQNEVITSWIVKGMEQSKQESGKKSLKDLANTITLPFTTDSVEITKELKRREL